jgi:type IV pilus assembly protein PilB
MTPPKLGDLLVRRGLLDATRLEAALADQRAFGGKLGRTLVELGYITDEQLMLTLAEQLGLTTVDLDAAALDPDALGTLAVDACERYGVFPVRTDRTQRLLWLATAEPDRKTLQEVAQLSQLTVEPVLAPMNAIDRAIRRAYYGEASRKTKLGEPMKSIPADAGGEARALPVAQIVEPVQEAEVEVEAEEALKSVAPEPHPVDAVSDLHNLIVRLERTVAAQGRAFRVLVDLLQEKGVVRRGELGSRRTKK